MTTTVKIKDLRKKIEFILEKVPQARDSDQYLTLCIWKNYYPNAIKNNQALIDFILQEKDKALDENFKKVLEKIISLIVTGDYVSLKDIMELPREDNIKRIRAKIQNEEHKWLPTKLEIAKQRNIEESVWRNYVNYN